MRTRYVSTPNGVILGWATRRSAGRHQETEGDIPFGHRPSSICRRTLTWGVIHQSWLAAKDLQTRNNSHDVKETFASMPSVQIFMVLSVDAVRSLRHEEQSDARRHAGGPDSKDSASEARFEGVMAESFIAQSRFPGSSTHQR